MTDHNNAGLSELVKEIRTASENINAADTANKAALDEIRKSMQEHGTHFIKLDDGFKAMDTKHQTLETSINELMKKIGRPGGEHSSDEEKLLRKSAIGLLETKHELKIAKKDPEHPFAPSEDQIKQAITYRKALTTAMHTVDHNTLPDEYRKSLSAFSFGTNAFILAPEMTNIVISCIIDPSDLGGLMSSMTTSSPSVRFLIDNARMGMGGWACEASCFANNPQPDLQEGLGELEIKPETIRMIVCATRDLIEDASINVESWIMQKVGDGMRATINNTLLVGDGVGKPMGLLNPNAGIPICDVSPATQPGQFTWQDLVMLKWEIPMQWQAGASYLMNQRTFALLMTMSDTSTKPLWTSLPGAEPGFTLAGSPIHIATQMPDVAPGATPVAYGNWKKVYMIVWRKAVTMQQDPYSAGFCILYKFEARVGGGILCPNAARLLRIK